MPLTDQLGAFSEIRGLTPLRPRRKKPSTRPRSIWTIEGKNKSVGMSPCRAGLSAFICVHQRFHICSSTGIFNSPSVWRSQARDFSIMGPAWPSHSMLRTPV